MRNFEDVSAYLSLQWGRAQLSAERTNPAEGQNPAETLQWGRAQLSAERQANELRWCWLGTLQWGRAQLSAESGYLRYFNSSRVRRFNGAALN